MTRAIVQNVASLLNTIKLLDVLRPLCVGSFGVFLGSLQRNKLLDLVDLVIIYYKYNI